MKMMVVAMIVFVDVIKRLGNRTHTGKLRAVIDTVFVLLLSVSTYKQTIVGTANSLDQFE